MGTYKEESRHGDKRYEGLKRFLLKKYKGSIKIEKLYHIGSYSSYVNVDINSRESGV
jgi:hypothetical protein